MSETRHDRADGSDVEWFRDWFGTEYLELYPHRDEEEAARAVALFRRTAHLPAGSPVLDLASGAGRHLGPLGRAGAWPVGLDLSWPLLVRARSMDPIVPLVRADMRWLPFRDASFAAVGSFFTSFGYFSDERDDLRVMDEVRRVLRPGGTFMLDFLNAERVRSGLVHEDEREISGRRVKQKRRIEAGRVVKRIEISGPEGGTPRVFHESVRLYEPEELHGRLLGAGLSPERRYGDYGGQDFDAESPRLIIVGRREDL